jgi:sulfatase maturation enzyme AslB (radical SAM superfamily)
MAHHIFFAPRGNVFSVSVVIVPTRFCNTDSCTYCHVRTRDFDTNVFTGFRDGDGISEKILALSEASGDSEIRFFGGEPLLRKEAVIRMVEALSRRSDRLGFSVNTNLLLADAAFFEFCRKYGVRLIVSCNGDAFSHSLSRGIPMEATAQLYGKIRDMVGYGIEHQINLVFQPETADRFEKNVRFVAELGAKNINLLPASYVEGWKPSHVEALREGFGSVERALASGELALTFENLRSSDAVHLFKSELVVDSDGNVYPNMVVMEEFFQDRRDKVKIASIAEDVEPALREKVAFYYGENAGIYDAYVNRFLEGEFSGTLPEEYPVRNAFNEFLERVGNIPGTRPS